MKFMNEIVKDFFVVDGEGSSCRSRGNLAGEEKVMEKVLQEM